MPGPVHLRGIPKGGRRLGAFRYQRQSSLIASGGNAAGICTLTAGSTCDAREEDETLV